MFKNLKAIFIAFIAITVMFGCKGPPRPGWHHRRPAPVAQQQAQSENEKAQVAAEKAQDKLDSE